MPNLFLGLIVVYNFSQGITNPQIVGTARTEEACEQMVADER